MTAAEVGSVTGVTGLLLSGSAGDRQLVHQCGQVPGCLTSSAVVAHTSTTLDVRTYVAELQRADEARLRARIEQAAADGDPAAVAEPAVLAGLVQTLWQGLSVRAELGADREELLEVVRLAVASIDPTRRDADRR